MDKELIPEENEINFIYLDKCYPVNLQLFRKNSNFFLRESRINVNSEPIELFNEFNFTDSYSEESVISFLGYCQDQPINLTVNNVISIKKLSTQYFVDQLAKYCDKYVEEHYHEVIDYFLSSKINSSEIYEQLISAHLDEYVQNDLLYELPTSTLHRIQQYYLQDNSKQKSKIMIDFLIATVSKKSIESQIFISYMKFNREEILIIKEQIENNNDPNTKNILIKFLFENPAFVNEYMKNEKFEKQEQARKYEKQIEILKKEGEDKERDYNEKLTNLHQTFKDEINQINNQLSLIFCNIDFKKPIILPNSATKISENQFKNLPVQEIILPDNVTSIEKKKHSIIVLH